MNAPIPGRRNADARNPDFILDCCEARNLYAAARTEVLEQMIGGLVAMLYVAISRLNTTVEYKLE